MRQFAVFVVGCLVQWIGPAWAGGSAWVDPATGIRFLEAKKGCFAMGAERAAELRRLEQPLPPERDELPRHKVCLDSFWLAETELTTQQWARLSGSATSAESPLPVGLVAWTEVNTVLQKFNRAAPTGVRLRLPTEAEWEYACRAGGEDPVYQPDSEAAEKAIQEVAWTLEHPPHERIARPVAGKKPNAWGFFDMLGNVWEMTSDGYRPDAYRHHLLYNPKVDQTGGRVVIRGGSYGINRDQARCGERNDMLIDDPHPAVGLRLVAEGVPVGAGRGR